MLLADGTIGQMMEPVELAPGMEPVFVEKDWAVTGTKGEREHHIVNSLYLVPEELEQKNFERFARYEEIEKNEARCERYLTEDAEIVVVAFGIAARVAKNAVAQARKEGVRAGLIRPITLWPFPKAALAEAAKTAKAFLVAELSMGQMIEDVKLSIGCSRPVALCRRTGGMIMSPDEVLAGIRALKGGESA